MESLPEPDNMLIQKLIDVAGISNDNLLSEEETLRGRALLSEAQSRPESTWKGDLSLSEHIARLSIAVAPHKRLSQEILELIFQSLSSAEKMSSINIPPELSKGPWLLGRVCSRWRIISRSMPNLWAITIDMRDDPYFGADEDYRIPLRKLERAVQILPDFNRICLRLSYLENLVTIATALCPFISQLSELHWHIRPESTDQQYPVQVFPSWAFSRLQKLRLNMLERDRRLPITFPVNLFGDTSKLEDLAFTSDVPNFLLTDIPWHQLRYFWLKPLKYILVPPTWLDLHQRNPFHSMTSLRYLTLYLSQAFFSLVLSFDFPWEQLKSLTVSWCNHEPPSKNDFQLIMETLQRCTALTRYEFRYHTYPTAIVTYPFSAMYPPIALPSLETLLIHCCVPSSMIISLSSAGGNLRSIKLTQVALDEFYLIILQCPRLVELTCMIRESDDTGLEDVVMHHLCEMTLICPSMLPLLSAPSLDSLTIQMELSGESNFLDQVANFIVHLDAKLETFKFDLFRYPAEAPRQPLVALLSLLNYCVDVHIDKIVLPHDVLAMIAARKLLPLVENVRLSIDDAEAFVNMVKHRLEEESLQLGRVILKEVIARRSSYNNIPDKIPQLELERTYGIRCILLDL